MKEITFTLLKTPSWDEYMLLDTGNGQKIERFGAYTFVRPETQATWAPSRNAAFWNNADAVFRSRGEEGGWEFPGGKTVPRFEMGFNGLKFWVEPTPFRHMGVFPEHASHWTWMEEKIKNAGRPIKVLNLFGYTGLASLAAAKAGAKVTHVDASKKMLAWARENQELSGLADKPIRWVPEDALVYIKREAKRGEKYDAIVLDPPKFGRGGKGEVWKIEENLPELLAELKNVLSPSPLFVVMTAYSLTASALSLEYALREILPEGTFETGEMVIEEASSKKLLSTAIFSRWSA